MPHLRRTFLLPWITAALFTSSAQPQDAAQSFFTAPKNILSVSELGTPFEMIWGDHRAGDLIIKRAFLIVPVAVEGIDRGLFMQFDLGAPSSILYRGALESVIERGGVLPTPSPGQTSVTEIEFEVGTTRVSARGMQVVAHGGAIDWDDVESRPFLGTLGADWIDGRVLVLDYARNQMQLCPKVPEALAEHEFEPFSFRGRRIFLPGVVDGKPGSLWFDTGSSAFELITDEETFLTMALEGALQEVYPAKSWGQPVKVHNIAASTSIVFGLTKIPVHKVSYIEWPDPRMIESMTQVLRETDMAGMCGNLLFKNNMLVLDAQAKRFWVGKQKH